MTALTRRLHSIDRPVWVALGFILLIMLVGTVYTEATEGTATFISPAYLLQQLKVASFLGLVAAGMMLVVLLGQIDLSVPWTLAASAMLATAVGGVWAIPVGLGLGLAVGIVNGFGVAVLRVPSMIFTLGVNTVLRGLMVMLTGGFSPQTLATPPMVFLGKGTLLGLPVAVLVWALASAGIVYLLGRTPMGRYIYAIGNSEAATYLSGINTRLVLIGCFALCSMLSAFSGLLIAGYSSKAFQAMGDPYLMPSIAAVVIGGTSILGGQGKFSGTVVGTVLIVLLQSMLSVMDMPEAGRQVIYGLVIIAMLLVYRRGAMARG
jgi:ribose transport system permease protein